MTEVAIAVAQAGGHVVVEAPPWPDSMAKVADARANVSILRPDVPDVAAHTPHLTARDAHADTLEDLISRRVPRCTLR